MYSDLNCMTGFEDYIYPLLVLFGFKENSRPVHFGLVIVEKKCP